MKYPPAARSIRLLWLLCATGAAVLLPARASAQPSAASVLELPRAPAAKKREPSAPKARPADAERAAPDTGAPPRPAAPSPARKDPAPAKPAARTSDKPSAKPHKASAESEQAASSEQDELEGPVRAGGTPVGQETDAPAPAAGKKTLTRQSRSASDPPAAAGKAMAEPPKMELDAMEARPNESAIHGASEEQSEGEPSPPAKKRGPRGVEPGAAGAAAKGAKSAKAAEKSPRGKDKAGRKADAKAARLAGAVGRQPTAEYRKLRDGWHAAIVPEVEKATIIDASGRIPLVIAPVNGGGEPVTLTPERADGGFSGEQLTHAARVFCPQTVKGVHAIAPHLLDLVYRAMRHFEAPLVRLVSGYRKDRAGSRHTQGRAIDMVLPGVTNEQLADYLRQFGFVGVGIYPKSGFVHLDVRENSFFWLDMSLPDERSRPEPILGDLAAAMDSAARIRGDVPDTFVPNNDREDKAAARSYAKRAQRRRVSAERIKSASLAD